MKVLVTGGLGFIGSYVVDLAIKAKHNVVVIDDLSGGNKSNKIKNVKYYICDCRDYVKIEKIFKKEKPKLIYHLAANAAENKSQFSPVDITSRNFDAFIKVLTAGIRNGMKRIVVTSSIAVYGDLPKKPYKESYEPNPVDLYGLSKLMMEKTLKIMSDVHEFEYQIVRPHNVYGPRQNMTDPYRNVVTIFMNSLLKGQSYFIYGDGSMKRCFSFIDEVAESIFKCGFIKQKNMIFNIGSDKGYSILELSNTIQKVSKINIQPKFLPVRPHEVEIALSDHTLAKKYLKYKDKTSLVSGIEKTWEYAKKLGAQDLVYTELEIENRKVPKNWKKK